MRLVVFSNLYPPVVIGGYEIGAALIVEELRRRGHQVLVLSAREAFVQEEAGFRHASHPDSSAFLDVGLCVFGSLPRLLRTHPVRFLRGALGSLLARRRYRRAVAAFRPDRILLFNPLAIVAPVMHDLSDLAREQGAEIHAFIGDDWLVRWPAIHPLLRPLDRLSRSPRRLTRALGRAAWAALSWTGWAPRGLPRVDRFFHCSECVRRQSRDKYADATPSDVILWGLPNAERLSPVPPQRFHTSEPLTLLFAGQIHERKGLDVLLRALTRCRTAHNLTVIGNDNTAHGRICRQLAAELNLTRRVRFLGQRTHPETLELLGRLGHVLVVPSVWDEPFGLVVLEGMAVGLPVLASDSGGPAEVIRDGETGFLFQRGNPQALAALIDRLEADRPLCADVSGRARQAVLSDFSFERMVDRLLGEAVSGGQSGRETPAAPPRPACAAANRRSDRRAVSGAAS